VSQRLIIIMDKWRFQVPTVIVCLLTECHASLYWVANTPIPLLQGPRIWFPSRSVPVPARAQKNENEREMNKAKLKKCMTLWSKFHMTCRDWLE
jgi:hypothetical protein